MEKLLTASELAEILGVSLATVYDWSHNKRVPRVPGMRLLRFRPSEIEMWLSRENGVPRASGDEPRKTS
ncbi:MAG: hypothetical protein OHK006_13920 [Thermodesulfovibrionales bacterium]